MKLRFAQNPLAETSLMAFLFLFLSFSPLQAETQTVTVPEIQKQADTLQSEWGKIKKEYHQRYDDLIGQIQAGIKAREKMLDNGDPKLRSRIEEERKDLERERDELKRRLAEISAANTVDFVKIKENIDSKIQDIKD